MGLVHFAFHLLRVASEAIFLFELNKVLGALVTGGRHRARQQSVEAEKKVLEHSQVSTRHVQVELPDGVVIHTLIANEQEANTSTAEKQEVVVLLHGHSSCGAIFFNQLKALCATGARVYAPDLPGWGRSSRPAFVNRGPDAGVAYYARRVLAWLHEMKLDKFSLIGHSLGGYLAHEIAVTVPEKICSLVLIAPAACVRSVSYSAAFWFCFTPQRFIAHAGLLADLLFVSKYPKDPCYSRPGVRAVIRSAFRVSDGGSGDAAAAALLRINHRRFEAVCENPLVERVCKVDFDISLVVGDKDPLVPLSAIQQLDTALRDAGNTRVTLSVLPNEDHAPFISKPNLFNNILSNSGVSKLSTA